MNAPRSIAEYLQQLRDALRGADPALIQDALYDAEEHLRAELAEQPQRSEADMLAHVVGSYGAPDEVAELYRDQEIKIQRALRPPRPAPRLSLAGRFFGVAADPHTYGALFYMLLALATGIFYFTWTVAGASMSAGFAVLIIGIPFVILFIGSTRILSLVEGRIVEVMLGERMPRRPLYSGRGQPWLQRIGAMFTDPRTWSTLLYFLAMLPLGIAYFAIVVTLLSVSLAFIASPILAWIGIGHGAVWIDDVQVTAQVDWWWQLPLLLAGGVVLLFGTLHLARGIGRLHGLFAKHLLVKSTQYA